RVRSGPCKRRRLHSLLRQSWASCPRPESQRSSRRDFDPISISLPWLARNPAPVAKPDCVRATADLLKLDRSPFERIFEFRASDNLPTTDEEANAVFAAYMDQIEHVIEAVDEMDVARASRP